jgi:hypothetical protein
MDLQMLLKVGEIKDCYGEEPNEELIILSDNIVKRWSTTS